VKLTATVGAVLLFAAAAALAAGCAGGLDRTPAAHASVAQADAPRDAQPQVTAGDLSSLVEGNSAFAFDLYDALRNQEGNLFFSPFSVSLALAMTYAGARGETEAQMARTLHYTLPQERLHAAFNALDQQLSSRGANARGQDGKPFRLKLANSVWGQTGYQFLPSYLETLARQYGAGLRLSDFQSAPEPSRVAINDWVEEQTEGKIVDLLPRGSIDALTRMVLVNAIYFNAAWTHSFEKANTRPGPFNLLDGRQVEVPMMSRTLHSLSYAKGDGFQAVELPYDGREVSMVILLPDAGGFSGFEDSLDAALVDAALSALQPRFVALTLPKFNYSSEFSLAKTLSAMGMPDAMVYRQADFSGMDGTRELFISDVVHKAVVAVDERGTEAAAATAVIVATASAPVDQPLVFTVDRPFVFLIRDLQTGAVLFVGRVLNPAG
jgi:serpin B